MQASLEDAIRLMEAKRVNEFESSEDSMRKRPIILPFSTAEATSRKTCGDVFEEVEKMRMIDRQRSIAVNIDSDKTDTCETPPGASQARTPRRSNALAMPFATSPL